MTNPANTKAKAIWLIVTGLIIGALVTVATLFFTVDKTLYTQVQKTDTQHIDTSKPLPQHFGSEPNDATLGTVFPYLAAPHQ